MQVRFFATARQITGCESCDIPAPQDVLELLKAVADRWPDLRGLVLNAEGTDKGDYIVVMVSGRYIEHLNGISTKLTEQDVVAITPVVAGG